MKTFSKGDKVRNLYGETGRVFKQVDNVVYVHQDHCVVNAQTWHVTKTWEVA